LCDIDVCRLVAGATRARISAHFAHKGHLADVTAKESTQETAVTLIGLGLGLLITKLVGNNYTVAWALFCFLMVLHQYANYELVRVLVLDNLNPQRVFLIVSYAEKNYSTNSSGSLRLLPTPQQLAVEESIYRPIWLYIFGPKLGCSIKVALPVLLKMSKFTSESMQNLWVRLLRAWNTEKFIITVDSHGRPAICLEEYCTEADCLKAYSIACHLMYVWPRHTGIFVSEQVIIKRIEYIMTSGALASIAWYEKRVCVPGLATYGWDVGEGKARLGEGAWRFCRDTIDKQK
jgi:hypothetical protein